MLNLIDEITYERTFSELFVFEGQHADDAAAEYEEADEPVYREVTYVLDAARSEEHVERNVELHHADQQPRRYHIRRPKQQQRFEHVKEPEKYKSYVSGGVGKRRK